jgi:ADP-heptose:LPS heptosyltransferase
MGTDCWDSTVVRINVKMKKFLLVHLVYNGDCLIATTIARQIKSDNPGCHLTWAISFKCKQVIENNPYVDQIWEVHYKKDESPLSDVWYRVKQEAEKRKREGEFDDIIYSQIFPDNLHFYDGTVRTSTFRAYPGSINVPVAPIIRLSEKEVENVKKFVIRYEFYKYKHILLCECTPNSGQSFISLELMLKVAEKIIEENKNIIFIVSSHLKIVTQNERIIDASELTYRENAELSKFCTLFIGCSSGITWLLTSDWAYKLPMIQFLHNPKKPVTFASVKYDFKYWGLPHSHILESTQQSLDIITQIINDGIENFEVAQVNYGEELFPSIEMLHAQLKIFSLKRFCHSLKNSLMTIKYFSERNKGYIKVSKLMPLFLIWVIIRSVIVKTYKFFLNKGNKG